MKAQIRLALLLLLPTLAFAQAPVDDDGNVIGDYEPQGDITSLDEDALPPLSPAELEELIGPVALYPDDLLAIVLPAAAYPLQIVEAARFLEAVESDPSLQPDPDWDDSVVALTNYPEVVELLNDDLDWTLRLGEAVVAQQADVVAAIESFRDRAYAAGNLKSDSYQNVAVEDDVIQITPVAEDVIYVPYYEPEQVVIYQPRPVYYYYPRPYPVYYYPYAAGHHFYDDHFWGVTTAFTIGWLSDSLHVYHHSYYGHPYYGRSYWDSWWYRRPSINVYNTTYISRHHVSVDRYRHGDRWRPSQRRRGYVVREGYTRDSDRRRSSSTVERTSTVQRHQVRNEPVSFRERNTRTTNARTVAPRRTDSSADNVRREVRRSSERVASQREQRAQPAATANNRQPRSKDFAFRERETNRQATAVRNESRQQAPSRSQRTTVQQQKREGVQNQRSVVPTQQRTVMARSERSQTRTQHAPTKVQQRAASQMQQRAAPQMQQRAPARAQPAPTRVPSRQTESRRPAQQEKSQSSRSSAAKSRESRSSGSRSHKRDR